MKTPKIYIVSSQIAGEDINYPLVQGMEVLASCLDAEIIILANYRENCNAALRDENELTQWRGDPRVAEYVVRDKQVDLGGTTLMGDVNIRPKSLNPLSPGILNLVPKRSKGNKHLVFAHPQIAVNTLPRTLSESRRSVYTTGTITQPDCDYYRRSQSERAAQFHHSLGFLVICGEHVYPVYANRDGSFQFLTITVSNSPTSIGYTVASLGDIHFPNHDRSMVAQSVSLLEMLDVPAVALHDLVDFEVGSHHKISTIDRYHSISNWPTVQTELEAVAKLTVEHFGEFDIALIESNHHRHLDQWLDRRSDKVNAADLPYWFKLNSKRFESKNSPFVDVLKSHGVNVTAYNDRKNVFQPEGILIVHGDVGVSGARGTPNTYARATHKSIGGHTHQETIRLGYMNPGCLCKLDPDYVKGLGAWTQGLVLVGVDGKRQLVTAQDGVLIPDALLDKL